VIINEPMPGEQATRCGHSGPKSARFELVRIRKGEMLIVRVIREKPFDTLPARSCRAAAPGAAGAEHLMGQAALERLTPSHGDTEKTLFFSTDLPRGSGTLCFRS